MMTSSLSDVSVCRFRRASCSATLTRRSPRFPRMGSAMRRPPSTRIIAKAFWALPANRPRRFGCSDVIHASFLGVLSLNSTMDFCNRRVILQSSPIAGRQYVWDGCSLWSVKRRYYPGFSMLCALNAENGSCQCLGAIQEGPATGPAERWCSSTCM